MDVRQTVLMLQCKYMRVQCVFIAQVHRRFSGTLGSRAFLDYPFGRPTEVMAWGEGRGGPELRSLSLYAISYHYIQLTLGQKKQISN